MKVLSYKPHYYFFATALIIMLAGVASLAINGDTMLDINVQDTYYVIAHIHLTALFVILYITAGLIYQLLRNFKLSKLLTKIHTAITIGSVPAYWIIVPLLGLTDTFLTNRAETAAMAILLVAVLVQPLFIINLIIGLVRGRIKHTHIM